MATEKLYPTLMDSEKAYLAGIIDGEGCIGIGGRRRRHGKHRYIVATLQVSNTNRELIEWLCGKFGGGLYNYSQQTTEGRGRKPTYLWHIASAHAQWVIECALPYLIVKRKQADIVLSIQKRETYRDAATGRIRVQMTDEDFAENDRLVAAIRELNQRGIGHAVKRGVQ